MKKTLIYLFLIIFFVPSFAQKKSIATLQKQLSTVSADTAIIDISILLSEAYSSSYLDSTIYYNEKAFELAKSIKDSKRLLNAQRSIITILLDEGNYTEGKSYIDRGLEVGHQLNDDVIICQSLISMAIWNWELSNLKESLEYIEKALIIAEKIQNLKLKAKAINMFALLYGELGEFEKQYDFATQYYNISLQINDTLSQSIALHNLGFLFFNQKEYSKALSYIEQALPLAKATQSINPILYELTIAIKVDALFHLDQKELGVSILESGLEMATKNKHIRTIIVFNRLKANYLFDSAQYDEATQAAKIGVDKCKETSYIKDLPGLCEILAKIYKTKGDFKSSLIWLEEEKKAVEEIAKRQKDKELIKIEAKYLLQQKETENKILLLKNKNKNIVLALLASTFLIISFLIFYFLRKKQAKQIEIFRQKIAADLHDDVGGNLNSISRIAKGLKSSNNSEELNKGIDILVNKSNTAIKNVVDVVWALDTDENKIGYLMEKMEDSLDRIKYFNKSVDITFNKENINEEQQISINVRHNLLMIFKEAINNIQKHTIPTSINITLKNTSQQFQMQVVNYFEEKKAASISSGHGIFNIKRRIKEMDGSVDIKETKNSFSLNISLNKLT